MGIRDLCIYGDYRGLLAVPVKGYMGIASKEKLPYNDMPGYLMGVCRGIWAFRVSGHRVLRFKLLGLGARGIKA